MKKTFVSITLAVLLLMPVALGAAGSREQAKTAGDDKLVIMTSFYIPYDFASKIAGDKATVINLIPAGGESHGWEPSIGDMRRLETADVLVVNGAGMEGWTDKVLSSLTNKNLKVVTLSDGVELLASKGGHSHDHGHGSFTAADVENRTLADFAGEWQSIYPYMLDGTLDETIRHSAENGDMTYEEMSTYYKKGFATDVDRLVVKGDSVTFQTAQGSTTVPYTYDGFVFLHYEEHDAQSALYRFKAADKTEGRFKYILFADHNHTSGPAAHFHLTFSKDGEVSVAQTLEEFATYFPASFSSAQIAAEMAAHGEGDDHADHDHADHAHAHDDHHHHDHGDFDPHTWLDLRNAVIGLKNITDALVSLDPSNAAYYQSNYDMWSARFLDLDARYRSELKNVSSNSIIVAHAAFGYMAHAYGLQQQGIEGVFADSEPSPARMAQIIDHAKEQEIGTIFTEQLISPKAAQAVAREVGASTAVLNPVEGLTQAELDAGRDYLSVMEDNLAVLLAALR